MADIDATRDAGTPEAAKAKELQDKADADAKAAEAKAATEAKVAETRRQADAEIAAAQLAQTAAEAEAASTAAGRSTVGPGGHVTFEVATPKEARK